jgi:hypothetical protein
MTTGLRKWNHFGYLSRLLPWKKKSLLCGEALCIINNENFGVLDVRPWTAWFAAL